MDTQSPPAKTFRTLLQEELLDRCRKNPRYSLRSFAHFLKIGSSDLSKIIHGKRGISEAMVLRLGKRLELEPEDIDRFRRQLGYQVKSRKSTTVKSESSFNDLDLETFYVVSDWYPLAILEMSKVQGFVGDVDFIARCLGITVNEVVIAVERLKKTGMLVIDEKGRYIDCAGSTTAVIHGYTDVAKRKYQKQILTKAIEAVDTIPVAERDQSSMLMAVDTAKLDEARLLIKEFRRQLCDLLESGEERNQVMFLSVSLFPVLDQKILSENYLKDRKDLQ